MYKLITTDIELGHCDTGNTFALYFNEDENKFIAYENKIITYENSKKPKIFEYELLVKPSNLNDEQRFEILDYCYGSGSSEVNSEISYLEIFHYSKINSKFINLVSERTHFLIDLYSDLIEVVDLEEAIKQTELFVGFSKDEPKKILYYSDLLHKLKNFKNN